MGRDWDVTEAGMEDGVLHIALVDMKTVAERVQHMGNSSSHRHLCTRHKLHLKSYIST